jgi:hypothetical protein
MRIPILAALIVTLSDPRAAQASAEAGVAAEHGALGAPAVIDALSRAPAHVTAAAPPRSPFKTKFEPGRDTAWLAAGPLPAK